MKLYYRTDNFRRIETSGFVDETIVYDDKDKNDGQTGVLLTNIPFDINLGDGSEPAVLQVDVPNHIAAQYEIASAKNHREFLIPAKLLNKFGPPLITSRISSADAKCPSPWDQLVFEWRCGTS